MLVAVESFEGRAAAAGQAHGSGSNAQCPLLHRFNVIRPGLVAENRRVV